jgi:hypothetical protein
MNWLLTGACTAVRLPDSLPLRVEKSGPGSDTKQGPSSLVRNYFDKITESIT